MRRKPNGEAPRCKRGQAVRSCNGAPTREPIRCLNETGRSRVRIPLRWRKPADSSEARAPRAYRVATQVEQLTRGVSARLLVIYGGRGELVNTPGCEPGMASSILVGHPSPSSTTAVQPPCKRKVRGSSPLMGTNLDAWSFNGRTRGSEPRNDGFDSLPRCQFDAGVPANR